MGRLVVMLLVGALAVTACGASTDVIVRGTDRARDAAGTAQIEEIEGGERLVTVSLHALPAPARLGSDLSVYVVWFEPPGGAAVKAGELAFDERSLEGSLMASTRLRTFRIKVTAERDGSPIGPGEVVVATQHVNED